MTIEEAVKEFHVKYGHLINEKPTTEIPEEVKHLRRDLIGEETDELFAALWDDNLELIADGIADSIYVLVGTALSYGIPIDRIFQEVHSSNMTKTPIMAENGQKYGTKTPKGPDYVAPDIKGILFQPDVKTVLERVQ